MIAASNDAGAILCADFSSALSSSFSVLLLTRIDPTAALQLKQSGCGNSRSIVKRQAKDGVSLPLAGLERWTDDQNGSIEVVHQPDGSCLVACGLSSQQLVSISTSEVEGLVAFCRPLLSDLILTTQPVCNSSSSGTVEADTNACLVSSCFPPVPLRTLDRTIEQLKGLELSHTHAFQEGSSHSLFLVSRGSNFP